MRVLIAGGGTGGHIYPALAIARALKEISADTQVEFVGTPFGLESRIVPPSGFRLHMIAVGKLHKSAGLLERIKTLCKMPLALLRAFLLVLKFKPDCVLGVGGYASGPVVLMAALLGRRTLIWEPNAYPGLANRWLSHFVDEALVVFQEAKTYLKCKKITQAHMPVRKEIEMVGERSHLQAEGAAHGGDRRLPFRILVFGGSQGARAINNALVAAVERGGEWLKGVEIVHQTGALDHARMTDAYKNISAQHQVQVLEYLNDMPERYVWADLVICRSGTGTISELAACGKAAILIPYPQAADDHQTKNAQALFQLAGARLLPQSELTPEKLIHEILFLKNNRDELAKIEQNIRRFHKPRAADQIAKVILHL